jgi:hypothetical protein
MKDILDNLCNNINDRIDFLKIISLNEQSMEHKKKLVEINKSLFELRVKQIIRHGWDIEEFYNIERFISVKLKNYPNNRKNLLKGSDAND